MFKKECLLFGSIFKLHGFKGEVSIYNEYDLNIILSKIEYLFIEIDNQLIPFFIENIRRSKPKIILTKFYDINTKNKAIRLKEKYVYIPKKWITKSNEISLKIKIIGYQIIDQKLGDLGKISFVNSQTEQKLIYVQNKNKEFCFPMHKEFIKNIDEKSATITVEIPNELLNLN